MRAGLLQTVRQIGTLGRAWRVIYENGRSSQSRQTRREIGEFANDAEARLTKIQRQLSRNAFRFAPVMGLEILKKNNGGIRPLVIAPIESRVVQRAIHDVLLTLPVIRSRAETPYSFGGVRKQQGKERGAVPAAIEAVMEAIGGGAFYVIRSDISSFFTKISKPTVTKIVMQATEDSQFVELFEKAIAVELANLADLRSRGSAFPIHEIGVAQGSSLSPLLGNLLLADFDHEMNSDGCRCLRYIDDFLILAPDRTRAEAQFSKARALLAQHGMEVNDKTCRSDVHRGFTFLGVEVMNGSVRPSRESRSRLIANVSETLKDGASALRAFRKTRRIDSDHALVRILHEVRGTLFGWGHHYSFCNETNVLQQMDFVIRNKVREYLGLYSNVLRSTDDEAGKMRILGVPVLQDFVSRPLAWGTQRPPSLSVDVPVRVSSDSPAAQRQSEHKSTPDL
jgi:retron-type reverse transcriptase